MKNLIFITAIFTAAAFSNAQENSHPGLPPTAPAFNYDTQTWSTTVNTKYGTSSTAEEIKAATQQRRATMKLMNDNSSDGSEQAQPLDSDTY